MTEPPTLPDDESPPDDAFRRQLEEFERGGAAPHRQEATAGTQVKGRIVSIGDEQAMVDFGGRSEGVLETRHLKNEAGELTAHEGDTLELFVVEAGDQVVLAPSLRADPKQSLRQMREAKEGGIPVSGRVTAVNPGGLTVEVGGLRGFCPASQIELGFCADPSAYVGRTLDLLVTEVDESRRRVVLSRRALLKRGEEQRAGQVLEQLKPGDEREGRVVRLEPFGAFVDLGGVDGMVHVSEIRHERTAQPGDVLKTGETVRVRVLSIEPGKHGRPRIALSIKAALPDPWAGMEERYPRGARVHGTVASLAPFGAFVALEPGIEGLVHVSEISSTRIQQPSEALVAGQEVDVIVLGVDLERKRISLSIRQTLPDAMPAERPAARERERGRPSQKSRRPRREEAPPQAPPAKPARDEPTTMAIALREAMERAKKKQKE